MPAKISTVEFYGVLPLGLIGSISCVGALHQKKTFWMVRDREKCMTVENMSIKSLDKSAYVLIKPLDKSP